MRLRCGDHDGLRLSSTLKQANFSRLKQLTRTETPEQLAILQSLGCHALQGFLLARPTADILAGHRTDLVSMAEPAWAQPARTGAFGSWFGGDTDGSGTAAGSSGAISSGDGTIPAARSMSRCALDNRPSCSR